MVDLLQQSEYMLAMDHIIHHIQVGLLVDLGRNVKDKVR